MSATMTLSEMMTAVRSRADMLPQSYVPTLNGNTQLFVSDAELIVFIQNSVFELYDMMIGSFGEDYFVKTPAYTFQTDGVNQLFALPTDFYKLLGVDVALSPGNPDSYVTLMRFNFSARNRYSVPNFQSFYGVTNLRYRLQGSNLWLTPRPASGQTIQVWYVPKLVTAFTALADTFDGQSGWLEYVIVDAAIKCLEKEESDTNALMVNKAALKARIEGMAPDRDAGMPATVSDNMSNAAWFPGGDGSGFGF